MKRRDPKTQLDLTDDEVAVLRSSTVPMEVKQFVTRQHDTIGARIMAYEKIAAAARAERLALQEIRRLHATRDSVTEVSEWRQQIANLEGEKAELLVSYERVRQQLARTTAIPALAVYADE